MARLTTLRSVWLPILLLPAAALAQAQTGVDADGVRYTEIQGQAEVGETRSAAALRLLCRPGPGGAVGWTLLIDQPEALAEFDFSAFDGAQAPTRDLRLATLGINGGVLQPTIDSAVNGARQDNGRFALVVGAESTGQSAVALLADAVTARSERLVWVVSQIDEDAALLRAEFALAGASAMLQSTMLGCGPLPELPESRLLDWQVRGAPVAEVLNDRAVAWRLAAAAGVEMSAVAERMRGAQPWRFEREVFYAVAEGASGRDGAVLQIGADNDALEALLIDDGVLRRLVTGNTALDPPETVRDFVAARTSAVPAEAPAEAPSSDAEPASEPSSKPDPEPAAEPAALENQPAEPPNR